MAMLNFKYGLHQNLPAAITNGTIYVTSDEHAMYVDLADKRIRISQIVSLPTITDWQDLTPPYSTEAFYYVIEANALLKYNGTEWVQINSTKALQDSIDALELRVKAIEDAKYGDKITSINQDITALQNKDKAHEEAISGLITRADGIDAKISGLNKAIGYYGAYGADATLPTLTETDKNTIVVHGDAVKIWDGAAWQDYNDIVQEIEDLKADLKEVSESVASNASLTALTNRVEALETWKNTADTAITTTLPESIAAALKAGQDAQKTADEAKATADANKTAIEDETSGLAAAHTAAVNAKTRADDAYNLADAAVTPEELNTAIKDFATDEEAQAMADAVLGDANDTADDKTVYGAHAAAAAASKVANENTGKITSLQTGLNDEKEAREKAIDDLRDEIVSDMQTADAMVFIDTVASASDLPEAGAEVNGKVLSKGWTYKASEEFVIGDGDDAILVHIGDLLIASGAETDGELTDVEWKHIPSGYIADYNPEMTVVDNGSNNVSVKLTSGVNKDDTDTTNDGDLGKVNFAAAEGSAVTVSAVAGQVSIGMEWASFDPVSE